MDLEYDDVPWFAVDRVGKIGFMTSAGGELPAGFVWEEQRRLGDCLAGLPDSGGVIIIDQQSLSRYLFDSYMHDRGFSAIKGRHAMYARKGLFTFAAGAPGCAGYAAMYWPELPLKSVNIAGELASLLDPYRFDGVFGQGADLDPAAFARNA